MSQPSIEVFLDAAFGTIQATSTAVGQVRVQPNCAVTSDESDRAGLADELVRCIREETAKPIDLEPPPGHDIQISDSYPLLNKYLRAITLDRNAALGSWVQVMPSGGFFEH